MPQAPRIRGLHINRMIPNVLTLLALIAGLSALGFALQQRWEHALLAVLAAAILDGLDGRIARILKGASKFGAELDSLSDFLCFGIVPALMLYLWSLSALGRFGWWLVVLVCICSALRLARFNALNGGEVSVVDRDFFVGLPSPAGAGLILTPLALWIEFDAGWIRDPWFVSVFVVATSILLVSRVRTFSFKRVRLAPKRVLLAMLAVGLYLACLVTDPWATLVASALFYVGLAPISDRLYRKRVRRAAAEQARLGAASDAGDRP